MGNGNHSDYGNRNMGTSGSFTQHLGLDEDDGEVDLDRFLAPS